MDNNIQYVILSNGKWGCVVAAESVAGDYTSYIMMEAPFVDGSPCHWGNSVDEMIDTAEFFNDNRPLYPGNENHD